MKIMMIAIIERECPRLYTKFWSWHLYTKSMTLCVTWRFYIQKARHFAKSKTIFDTFLYTKIKHFCVTRIFIEFLKFAEGGGHVFIKKTMYFVWKFYIEKQDTLRYVATYKEPDTMRYILISKKQYIFLNVYIYIIYRVQAGLAIIGIYLFHIKKRRIFVRN